MQGIDLDPCTCDVAQELIQADRYFTEYGLEKEWEGKVLLNPPGGKGGATSIPAQWWRKLMASPRVEQAIVIGFNPSILFTAQCDEPGNSPTDHMIAYPRQRIAYDRIVDGERTEGKQPPHHSVVIGVRVDPERFIAAFSTIGKVVCP
jgi:hypothetical protein